MKHYLHVAFNTAEPRPGDWKEIFDSANDWLRYAPNCWILHTGRNAQTWYERIKPALRKTEHVFICEIVITNRQGWLPKTAWEWINRAR